MTSFPQDTTANIAKIGRTAQIIPHSKADSLGDICMLVLTEANKLNFPTVSFNNCLRELQNWWLPKIAVSAVYSECCQECGTKQSNKCIQCESFVFRRIWLTEQQIPPRVCVPLCRAGLRGAQGGEWGGAPLMLARTCIGRKRVFSGLLSLCFAFWGTKVLILIKSNLSIFFFHGSQFWCLI